MHALNGIKSDSGDRNYIADAAKIDIDVSDEIMEKFEDEEDIAYLKETRNQTLSYRKFGEYLAERENV